MKKLFIISLLLMSTISCYSQLYRRGVVRDSIMTVGNNHKYLVLTDSTWKMCNVGNILNAPFDGTFTLFYPCYVPNSEGKYVKQTFELANGKIIHKSKVKRFPSDANPMDTVDVFAESKTKKVIENIRPLVSDSLMTIGSNQFYLVKVDSIWWVCQGGNIENKYSKPFTGSYSLFYPCFIYDGRHYLKQSFEFNNGKMINKSSVYAFPSDANPIDTTLNYKNSYIEVDNKPKTQAYLDSIKKIEDNATLEANMDILSSHQGLTQFTNMDFNFVNLRIQNFMNDVMEYTVYGEGSSDFSSPIKTITQKYFPKISSNNLKSFIQFKYVVLPNGNALTIKSCEISGNLNYLIDFYVSYWTTKINIEGRKEGEIVHNHLLNDDISFQFFPSTGKGKIVVSKNQ